MITTKEQLKRWAEHFRKLLNRPTPDSPPYIPSAETELPISCDKPSKTEIKKSIMSLRSGKAAGPDEIPAEAIKADIETAVNMLYSLFSKIWEKEEVPAQRKERIIIKLPKKETLGTTATIEESCSWQGSQQGSTGEDKDRGCRPQAPRPAGRLPVEQILCRPDRQPAHHRGTVVGVELPRLHQLHKLREGL